VSRILLDTSAYVAFMSGHPRAVDAVREAEEVFLSATVLGELLAGFAGGNRRERNERQLAKFVESSRVGIVDVDDDTATRYAAIHAALRVAGKPIPTNDLWIAASAMQHGLHVLTLDAHFLRAPQILTIFLG